MLEIHNFNKSNKNKTLPLETREPVWYRLTEIVLRTLKQAQIDLDFVFSLVVNEQNLSKQVLLVLIIIDFQLRLLVHQFVWVDLKYSCLYMGIGEHDILLKTLRDSVVVQETGQH